MACPSGKDVPTPLFTPHIALQLFQVVDLIG